jgi:hypothetical protein
MPERRIRAMLQQDLNSVIAAVEEAAHAAIRDAEAGDYEGAARRLEEVAKAIRPVSESLASPDADGA